MGLMNKQQELRTAVSLLVSAYANMERAMKILHDCGIEVNNCARFVYGCGDDLGRNNVLLSRGMTTLAEIVGEEPVSIYLDGSFGRIRINGVDFTQAKMKAEEKYEDRYE